MLVTFALVADPFGPAVIGFLHLPHCVAGTVEMTAGLATGTVGPLAVARFIVVAIDGNAIGAPASSAS